MSVSPCMASHDAYNHQPVEDAVFVAPRSDVQGGSAESVSTVAKAMCQADALPRARARTC